MRKNSGELVFTLMNLFCTLRRGSFSAKWRLQVDFRFLFAYNGSVILGAVMNIQVRLGARIRELRLKKGWSQEEFADVCGLHRSHMGEIERGRANVTLATLVIIVQKLQTTVSALFEDLG